MGEMINISFFGASVTAQKLGYVYYFNELVKSHSENFTINKHGYGGMHLCDAGICFIDEILKHTPNYCFLDWFGRGISDKQELYMYLDLFRYKFIGNNCQIIFLLLPYTKSHITQIHLTMYKHVISYAEKYEIPYINVYEQLKEEDESALYRDNVHPLEYGSRLYGNQIYQEFVSNILEKDINRKYLIENKFSNIKKIKIEKDKIEKFIKIKGCGQILGIHQTIGPHSGVLDIECDGRFSKVNLWDKWSYYERPSLRLIHVFKNYLNIFISDDDFDRSSAKEQVNWAIQKIIKPVDYLYYIGEIEIVEIK